MNYKVHSAYDEGCQNERWNGLNRNTPMDKVKLGEFGKIGRKPEDDRVHEDEPEPKREDDDGAEDKREDRFEEKIEDGEREAEEDEAHERAREDKPRNPAVRKPQGERVAGDDEG